MKVRADRKRLADALAWVSQVIDKRPVTPVLACVRLTVAGDDLTVAGFNYETGHTARLAVEGADDGECVVSGHLLREFVAAFRADEVELVLDDSRLSVACGRATYRLGVMPVEDYPTLPTLPTQVGTIAADDLNALLGVVGHAVSRNETPAALTGVHLMADADTLTAQTTDRFRMAQASIGWTGEPFTALVPATALTAAVKGISGTVRVGYDDGLFGLADDHRAVTTRVLDEDFPDFSRFFDLPQPESATVDGADLAEAAKRAALASRDGFSLVRMGVRDGEVTITAEGAGGDGTEVVACESDVSEVGRDLLLNALFLADALTACTSTGAPVARLGFAGAPHEVKPVFVTPAEDSGGSGVESLQTMVMPRRLT